MVSENIVLFTYLCCFYLIRLHPSKNVNSAMN